MIIPACRGPLLWSECRPSTRPHPLPSPYLTHPTVFTLPHLAAFSAHGPDAATFLQGQLTQDVQSMNVGQARAGGYCSAKGRLLGNFVIVHPQPQVYWFITHASVAPALVKRLKMFVLRAQCTVQERPDLVVQGHLGQGLAPWVCSEVPVERDLPTWDIGWMGGHTLRIGPVGETGRTLQTDHQAPLETDWQRADIEAGWPWIEAATVEQFVPQMVNFEVLGGVNFRKGCYPGQEVVARSQYRGTLKRRMALYEVQGPAPAAGTEVFDEGDPEQPAGLVVNAAPASNRSEPELSVMLAEIKIAVQSGGRLHLGSVQGPLLHERALPYRVPVESEI